MTVRELSWTVVRRDCSQRLASGLNFRLRSEEKGGELFVERISFCAKLHIDMISWHGLALLGNRVKYCNLKTNEHEDNRWTKS